MSLISIGQLCDDNYDELLNKKKLYAFKENELILEGNRKNSDGLWDIPVQKQSITQKNYALSLPHPSMYKNRAHKAQHTSILQNTANHNNTMRSLQQN